MPGCGFKRQLDDQMKRRNAGLLGHLRKQKREGKLSRRGRQQLEAHELISERLKN